MSSTTNYIDRVFALTNIERTKVGLAPLTFNTQLFTAAQNHSLSMANNDFFSHINPNGSDSFDRIQDTGYQYSTAGENIAAGYLTPEAVVQGWMNSQGHRANLLNPNFTEIGLGYFYLQNDRGNVNYNSYWTQIFARPLSNNNGVTKVGADSNDDLLGTSRNDRLIGGRGNDSLRGSSGNDRLSGYSGNDILLGHSGHDTLSGGSGHDYLNGYGRTDAEYDTLSGGRGVDKFILGNSWGVFYLGNGFATITDWNSADDVIQVRGNSVTHSYGSRTYSLNNSQNWSGTSTRDTAIYYGSDLIGIVQDTTNVSFHDFQWV